MKIHRPTREQFIAICAKLGFHFTESEDMEYLLELDKLICHYDKLNIMNDNIPKVKVTVHQGRSHSKAGCRVFP